jgi:hypothetical protein
MNGTTKAVLANIAAANGDIHLINQVFIPTGLHVK